MPTSKSKAKKRNRKKRPLREPVKQEVRVHHQQFTFNIDGTRYSAEMKIWKELQDATS